MDRERIKGVGGNNVIRKSMIMKKQREIGNRKSVEGKWEERTRSDRSERESGKKEAREKQGGERDEGERRGGIKTS